MSKPREYYALKSELIDADNFDTFRPEDFTRVREVLPATECEADLREALECIAKRDCECPTMSMCLKREDMWRCSNCIARDVIAKAKGRAE